MSYLWLLFLSLAFTEGAKILARKAASVHTEGKPETELWLKRKLSLQKF